MTSTPTPTTLRQLAGLSNDPLQLEDATLIVIDAQVAYTSAGQLPLEHVDSATSRIAELLDRARSLSTPIVHVQHLGAAGSPFDPAEGGRFMTAAEPRPGEFVVTKSLPNAFAGTKLSDLLDSIGPRSLLLCGFMTHMCVSSTARAALDAGIHTAIASDATATRSLPSATGSGIVAAANVHQAALAALADRFSVVATTEQILDVSMSRTAAATVA